MNLHRSNSKPDWETVATARRNIWQRTAAATNGLLTPGNVATFAGIMLVIFGLVEVLDEHYWWGCALIVVGRLCDLLDGWLAEITKTKSPLGESFDVAVDKLGTLLTIIVFYIAMLAPWWVLTALLLPHLAIAFISLKARRENVVLHPSRAGKLSMAAVWVALFGLVIAQGLSWTAWSVGTVTVYVVAIISVAMGVFAATGYLFNQD